MRRENHGANSILGREYKVLDHGHVVLLDYMGTDECIDDAARQSFLPDPNEVRTSDQIRNLIRYLMRHSHTSPFEMCELKFHIKAPLVIWRQWVRHRTANINEASGRYEVLRKEFYLPEPSRMNLQSRSSKQGSSEEIISNDEIYRELLKDSFESSYDDYEKVLDSGLAKEISRMALPLSTYVEAVWKMDLHNLFHFLKLRLDTHAQWEFRQYARVIEEIVETCFPLSHGAFVDYKRDAWTLSRMEIAALFPHMAVHQKEIEKSLIDEGCSKREVREFMERISAL